MIAYRRTYRMVLSGLVLLGGSAFVSAAGIESGLPADTTAVVSVNLRQVLHAPIIKQHALASLRQLCEKTEPVRMALAAFGLDPLRDLDRFTVAVAGPAKKAEGIFVLRGRFDTEKFAAAAERLVEAHSDRLQVHEEDGLTCYSLVSKGKHDSFTLTAGANSKNSVGLNLHSKGNLLDACGDLHLAMPDKETLIVSTSLSRLKQTCKHLREGRSPALSKRLHRLLAELESKQTVIFATCPLENASKKKADDSSTAYGIAPLSPPWETAEAASEGSDAEEESEPSPLRELSGSISLMDDFKLRCAVRTESVADAREVMKHFEELRLRADGLMTLLAGSNKAAAYLKAIPSSFVAVRKNRIILVEGRLSAEILNKLLGALDGR